MHPLKTLLVQRIVATLHPQGVLSSMTDNNQVILPPHLLEQADALANGILEDLAAALPPMVADELRRSPRVGTADCDVNALASMPMRKSQAVDIGLRVANLFYEG